MSGDGNKVMRQWSNNTDGRKIKCSENNLFERDLPHSGPYMG